MTKWLKKLWFKLTYDEIAMKCRWPLGKSLFIFVLMSGICSAQTINYVDVNGVTKLYIRTGTSTPETTSGTLQFKSSTYSVSEDGSAIRVYVSRASGSDGAASVNYATANGTAIADTDYTAASGTLNWIDGNTDDKYFDVTIIDNNTVGSSRNFTVGLSSASGASLGSITSTTITITEDDTVSLDYDPNWPYGIGIPTPTFGTTDINDITYRMYDNEANQNPELTYNPSDSGGYYTHYIDSNDDNSTDSSNPYGTKAKPRKTIPRGGAAPLAGSIVEIHATTTNTPAWGLCLGGVGTTDMPIFYRGVGKPNVGASLNIGYYDTAQYIIVEGILCRGGGILAVRSDWYGDFDNNHIAIRNCESKGDDNHSAGFGISDYTTNSLNNIVLYNNEIHDAGVWDIDYNDLYQFDFMEYASDEDAQANWSGTGATIATTTTHATTTGYPNEYALSVVTDGVNDRYITQTKGLDISIFTSLSWYDYSSSSSSSYQFFVKDSSDNESYWNATTNASINTWTQHYLNGKVTSPDANNGTNASLASIVSFGFKNLDANNTYIFDRLVGIADRDMHGVNIDAGEISYVWILDNTFYHLEGDGVQVGKTTEPSPHHVYVGANIAYDNKQSGFWTKTAFDVIFSQNTVYGMRHSNSADGPGMGVQYDPKRVWYLFNRLYENKYGIYMASQLKGGRDEINYIGNLVYDGTSDGAGLMVHNQLLGVNVLLNTVYNCPVGIIHRDYKFVAYIYSNIISGCPVAVDVYDAQGSSAVSELDNCLLYNTSSIKWDKTYADLDAFQTGTIWGDNCVEADPLFVNTGTYDFDLQAGSPFKSIEESSAIQTVIDRFNTLYGVDISDEVRSLRVSGVQKAP